MSKSKQRQQLADNQTRLVMVTNPFPNDEGMHPDVITLHLENIHRPDGSRVQDQTVTVNREVWSFMIWMLNSVGHPLGEMPFDGRYTDIMDDDTFVIAKIM